MIIRVINVGFGDCFILTDDYYKELLMVDCGSRSFIGTSFKNNYELAKYIYDTFLTHISNSYGYCSALLTHFHADHYSGFKTLALKLNKDKIFNRFYIPNILLTSSDDKDSKKTTIFIEFAIYIYLILGRKSASYIVADNILDHIYVLTKLAKRVIPLSYNDNFYIMSKKFTVLWPFKNGINTTNLQKDRVNTLSKALENIKDTLSMSDFEFIIEENDIIVDWYVDIITSEYNTDRKFENGRDFYEVYDDYRKELDNFRKQIRENANLLEQLMKILNNNVLDSFLDYMDDVSLVFHNNSDNENILMTGDISIESLEAIKKK